MPTPLFQPRTLTLRAYGRAIAMSCGMAVLLGIGGSYFGLLTPLSLALRSALVLLLGAGSVWAYARLQRAAVTCKADHLPWIHAATATIGMGVLFMAMGVMASGTSVGSMLPIWMLPFFIGITLAKAGWGRRVGTSMHCPTCEYEFGYEHVRDAPIRCPECGNAWLGRLLQGRKVRSRRIIALGVCITISGMVVMNPIFWLGPLGRYLPTPVLYTTLYAAPRNAYTAWDELALRTLNPRWTRIMGERVLSNRQRDSHDRSPGKWFEAAAMSGTMPAELVDRFYVEGFDASLHAPSRVNAGEPFNVSLRVRRALNADNVLGVMLAGYTADGGIPIIGRHTRTLWARQLNPRVFSSHKDAHTATLRIATPGEHRIRAVYWLSYQKSFTDELEWQPDGTPATPIGAVWFRRFEIETTIVVE